MSSLRVSSSFTGRFTAAAATAHAVANTVGRSCFPPNPPPKCPTLHVTFDDGSPSTSAMSLCVFPMFWLETIPV